jgi:hypothetical protein
VFEYLTVTFWTAFVMLRRIGDLWIWRDVESVVAYYKILSQNWSIGTEENQELIKIGGLRTDNQIRDFAITKQRLLLLFAWMRTPKSARVFAQQHGQVPSASVCVDCCWGLHKASMLVKGWTTGFPSWPLRPDRLCGPSSFLSNGYWGSYPGSKAAEAWSWQLTSI